MQYPHPQVFSFLQGHAGSSGRKRNGTNWEHQKHRRWQHRWQHPGNLDELHLLQLLLLLLHLHLRLNISPHRSLHRRPLQSLWDGSLWIASRVSLNGFWIPKILRKQPMSRCLCDQQEIKDAMMALGDFMPWLRQQNKLRSCHVNVSD